MPLTETAIRKAKEEVRPHNMSDSGGLRLVVTPAGGKLWRWKYRFEGKEELMALGKYPEVSLAGARELHREGRRDCASNEIG